MNCLFMAIRGSLCIGFMETTDCFQFNDLVRDDDFARLSNKVNACLFRPDCFIALLSFHYDPKITGQNHPVSNSELSAWEHQLTSSFLVVL